MVPYLIGSEKWLKAFLHFAFFMKSLSRGTVNIDKLNLKNVFYYFKKMYFISIFTWLSSNNIIKSGKINSCLLQCWFGVDIYWKLINLIILTIIIKLKKWIR